MKKINLLDNERYYNSYIKGTYPLNGKPESLYAFHHHIKNRQHVTGMRIALILNDLLKIQARCKRAGVDVDELIGNIDESCRAIEHHSEIVPFGSAQGKR